MNSPAPPPCPGPLDLTDVRLRRDPYPAFRWYREHDPLHCLEPSNPDGVKRYLVTRWDDAEAGLKDLRLRREVHGKALWNQPPREVAPEFASYARIMRAWPLFKDPPRHAKVRRPVNRVLDRAMSEAAEPLLDEVTAAVVSQLPRHAEFDAVKDFGQVVPLELDRQLFGLEGLDLATLGPWLQSIGMALGNVFDATRIEHASRSIDILSQHLEESIQRCRAGKGRAPMLAKLVELAGPDGLIEESQIIPLSILLIQAAQDSVIGALANGLITFLRYPEQRDQCLAVPNGFTHAVGEVLRFESPVQQVTRHAWEDLALRDVTVRAGEGVSFLLGSANRDPAVFSDPDTFDVTRTIPRTAAFGFGAHSCPGVELGKRIAARSWQEFFTRFPRLEYDESTVAWRPTVTFRTLASLPVKVKTDA